MLSQFLLHKFLCCVVLMTSVADAVIWLPLRAITISECGESSRDCRCGHQQRQINSCCCSESVKKPAVSPKENENQKAGCCNKTAPKKSVKQCCNHRKTECGAEEKLASRFSISSCSCREIEPQGSLIVDPRLQLKKFSFPQWPSCERALFARNMTKPTCIYSPETPPPKTHHFS
jgi:hypothetical protein